MNKSGKKYLSSEEYRQMLVRDGQRRFQEWHSSFINYQQQFLQDQENKRREMNE